MMKKMGILFGAAVMLLTTPVMGFGESNCATEGHGSLYMIPPQGLFTCGDALYNYYYCEKCHECLRQDFIGYVEHAYSGWVTVRDANCVQSGLQQATCTKCGQTMTQEFAASGHSLGAWETVTDPTCAAAGKRQTTCSVCGEVVTEEIPVLPHTFGEPVVAKAATDHSNAVIEKTCKECGAKETEETVPEGTIAIGEMRGELSVYVLQELLAEEEVLQDNVDGIFGQNTENAIKEIQRKYNFEETGIAYPQTIDQLMKNLKERLNKKNAEINHGISVDIKENTFTFTRGEDIYVWEIEAETKASLSEDLQISPEEKEEPEAEDIVVEDEEWNCTSCGNRNDASFNFCPNCGMQKQ